MKVDEFKPLTKSAIRSLLESRHSRRESADGPDKRRLPRWALPGQVEIWVPEQDGSEVHNVGDIRELNEIGVGVQCGLKIEPGQVIFIAIHQPEASFHGKAIVRHCTPHSTGYHVGLEFECA